MKLDLTTIEGAKKLLLKSRSSHEWNTNCTKIRKANGNKYPDWWFAEIIVGGVLTQVHENWLKVEPDMKR